MTQLKGLRRRVEQLIKAIEAVPTKHRTPAMEKLLTSLRTATAEYDKQE